MRKPMSSNCASILFPRQKGFESAKRVVSDKMDAAIVTLGHITNLLGLMPGLILKRRYSSNTTRPSYFVTSSLEKTEIPS